MCDWHFTVSCFHLLYHVTFTLSFHKALKELEYFCSHFKDGKAEAEANLLIQFKYVNGVLSKEPCKAVYRLIA